ncbi:MAG: hypothetical protein ACLS28_02630 [Clostridium neonatale]
MKFGKNIKLYLLDGDANGRWICELSNWTGKAYKIPRNYYKECQERKELITSGVYFLLDIMKRNQLILFILEKQKTY